LKNQIVGASASEGSNAGRKEIPQRLKPSMIGGFYGGAEEPRPFKAKNDTENDAAIYLIS
jgi:hypothetical protein